MPTHQHLRGRQRRGAWWAQPSPALPWGISQQGEPLGVSRGRWRSRQEREGKQGEWMWEQICPAQHRGSMGWGWNGPSGLAVGAVIGGKLRHQVKAGASAVSGSSQQGLCCQLCIWSRLQPTLRWFLLCKMRKWTRSFLVSSSSMAAVTS